MKNEIAIGASLKLSKLPTTAVLIYWAASLLRSRCTLELLYERPTWFFLSVLALILLRKFPYCLAKKSCLGFCCLVEWRRE
ncbi:hypothetical protein PanWU01x14_166420 [Parasponia andersonii]|uniref:Transmembrane protein n=1 Tax=Parasponia andersonii TaxID=3476 RepID=A0A2P5CBJ7_PARAD|nr:hypothetical protein PanWU01x14_166420 [Parasponia andersonii]